MEKSDTRFNVAYTGERPDILKLISSNTRSLLDVGCATGNLGEYVRRVFGAHVVGVELSPDMACIASSRLDEVIVGDANKVLSSNALTGRSFDCIVFGDLLEHLSDPWDAVRRAAGLLAPGGTIIASLPNVRHIDTIFNLVVKGRWPIRDRGIHDRSHLRFFTRKDSLSLFEQAGLRARLAGTNYRIIEHPSPINRLSRLVAIAPVKEFFAFQYLICAQRESRP